MRNDENQSVSTLHGLQKVGISYDNGIDLDPRQVLDVLMELIELLRQLSSIELRGVVFKLARPDHPHRAPFMGVPGTVPLLRNTRFELP